MDDLVAQLGQILHGIVLPMLLLAGVGYWIQRTLGLDSQTLTRLNFYLVMPSAVFYAVITSDLSLGSVGIVVLFEVLLIIALFVVALAAARLRGLPADQRNVLIMNTVFHNSGNYGLPLQDLAWRSANLSSAAMLVQALVMILQNITNFTVGVLLAAGGREKRHWKENLWHIAKLPPLYALAAALLTVQIRAWLGDNAPAVAEVLYPFWRVIEYVRSAFIAVATCTLGAQLARVRHDGTQYPISLSVLLRLLIAPVLALGIIRALKLQGFMAQVLLISAAPPTALNVMLLCLEFDNHPDFAARAVYYSTLASPLSVTVVVFLAQGKLLL